MMPEGLLNELEQTAQRTSVREALVLAFQSGQFYALREAFMFVSTPEVIRPQPENKDLDRHWELRGGCFEEYENG